MGHFVKMAVLTLALVIGQNAFAMNAAFSVSSKHDPNAARVKKTKFCSKMTQNLEKDEDTRQNQGSNVRKVSSRNGKSE